MAVFPAVKIDLIRISPFFNLITKESSLVLRIFKLSLLDFEFFLLRPGKHSVASPEIHVVSQHVSSAPPGFIGLVLASALNLDHLYKIFLSIKPGSLNTKLINVGSDLLVLHVVGVDEVQGHKDCDSFEDAGECYTDVAWRNFDCDQNTPEPGEANNGVKSDNSARVRFNVVVLRVVLVNWEDPGGVIDGHFVHAGSISDPSCQGSEP